MYCNDDKVEIRINGSHPQHLTVNIYNSGEPIDEAERKMLFVQYFRGKNSARKKGFGLGLILTQKIISHHGGEISYSYTADQTNNFEIRLPYSS